MNIQTAYTPEITDEVTPAAAETICALDNAVKTYRIGSNEIRALDGLTLNVAAGEFTAIVGPSGSGKSTLLNMLGCIELPDSGTATILGHETATMSDKALTALRRDAIGFIFQNFSLIPVLSAAENVEYPLILSGMPAAERREHVAEMLDRVGLGDRADHVPGELSGGQRQRVAIARALIKSPKLVIADEPTANLDSSTGKNLMSVMRSIQEDLGTTFIIATHDPSVQQYARRVVRIVDGKISQGDN